MASAAPYVFNELPSLVGSSCSAITCKCLLILFSSGMDCSCDLKVNMNNYINN